MEIVEQSAHLEHEVDGEEVLRFIEKIGRVCYKSECKITEESARGFVQRLLESKHESVLEHYNISVRVVCDRGVSHEIVRHRIASYSQESTRYCNYTKKAHGSGNIRFVEPPFKTATARTAWRKVMEDIEQAYGTLIAHGETPQMARSILPNSLKTELVMTMNLREWRHFFRLRTHQTAHPQMREVANKILDLLSARIPILFDEFLANRIPQEVK